MVEFANDSDGPGRTFIRSGDPRSRGQQILQDVVGMPAPTKPVPGHPFSPKVWWRNAMTAQEEGMAARDALMGQGWEAGVWPAGFGEGLPPKTVVRDQLDMRLTQVFDQLSSRLAGGQRKDPRDLLPEVGLPDEGIVPEDMLPEVEGFDWFDPTVWARAQADEISMVDLSNLTPATGPGKDGKGLDWFRSGEAPGNYQNRHNPLYKARREFAMIIAPQIEKLFGVSAQGSAGHMRQPSSGDAAPGGRSANSDHYSGGAIDFFGTKEEMVALRNWAVQQPFTSFVRCQSESHYDHVHISFDVGWIAQNFFQGKAIPTVSGGAKSRIGGAPEAARRTPLPTRNRVVERNRAAARPGGVQA